MEQVHLGFLNILIMTITEPLNDKWYKEVYTQI